MRPDTHSLTCMEMSAKMSENDECKMFKKDNYFANIMSQEDYVNSRVGKKGNIWNITKYINPIDFQNGNHDYWPSSGWIIDPSGKKGGPWKNMTFRIFCGKIVLI